MPQRGIHRNACSPDHELATPTMAMPLELTALGALCSKPPGRPPIPRTPSVADQRHPCWFVVPTIIEPSGLTPVALVAKFPSPAMVPIPTIPSVAVQRYAWYPGVEVACPKMIDPSPIAAVGALEYHPPGRVPRYCIPPLAVQRND